MRWISHWLARLCWRAAFWLEGAKPTEIIGPKEAALHERRGLERLARDIGVNLAEEATPGGDRAIRRAFDRVLRKLTGVPRPEPCYRGDADLCAFLDSLRARGLSPEEIAQECHRVAESIPADERAPDTDPTPEDLDVWFKKQAR